ncbi:MAG: hypothetical protein HY740_05285 [Chloroflexi bacterium]|nr:hypothetical protein [Chloroflexota bacterium]
MEKLEKKNADPFPDLENCRAKKMAPEFAECLVKNPRRCRFVLPFGDGNFCRHPKREEIIKQTH